MTSLIRRKDASLPSIFDDFFSPWNEWIPRREEIFKSFPTIPSVNISEDSNGYKVALAAPGLKREDFKIDIEGNRITISSEREESDEKEEAKYTRREYNYTSFSRSFTLPEDVNRDKIEAKYADGVLNLSLPRKEEVKRAVINKQIEVK